MVENYKTIYTEGSGEIIEKKSRFIATAYPINNEAEAEVLINQVKKKYRDASHNCYAFVLGVDCHIQRYSDDGEPNNTAGKPILDVIMGEELCNCIVFVTRYFGGTLLGTGGLIRAYSKASKEGIANSIVIKKQLAYKLHILSDYSHIGKMQYILNQLKIVILSSDYRDNVAMKVLIPVEIIELFKNEIIEATGGKAILTEVGMVYYADVLGEVKIFD